jgi:uncharacterized DUF497 family protein
LTRGTHCHSLKVIGRTELRFDPAKNARLVRERGISFEQIIELIADGKLLQVRAHPNQEKYPNQLLNEIDVGAYVYVVPVVKQGLTLILKIIYLSRKAAKKYKGDSA